MKTHSNSEARFDIQTGECAILNVPASGPDTLWFCGRQLAKIDGERVTLGDALGLLRYEMARAAYWPNLYKVGERGDVEILSTRTGKAYRVRWTE